MKKYFRKFGIMFVMTLAIIGIGVIQHGGVANAATVGQQLTSPESGWQRYDNTDSKILYNGFTQRTTGVPTAYEGTDAWSTANKSLSFSFYGTKLRLIGVDYSYASRSVKVTIDGNSEIFDCSKFYGSIAQWQILQYEKTGLTLGNHDVTITDLDNSTQCYYFDCLDIDNNGYLLSPSISLDKSSMDLNVNDSQQLTATTTPAAVGVTWTSSDEAVATVDQDGNVTAVGEGTCTIISALTNDIDVSDSCTVNVTEPTQPTDPDGGNTDPTEPTGDANLFIELVDGNIKQYDVDDDEINKFTQWYENRDKDHSLAATYKFAKGTYKDYVVHDQIDWFEVR